MAQERLAGILESSRLRSVDDKVRFGRVSEALADLAANLKDGIARKGTGEWLATIIDRSSFRQRVGPALKHSEPVWGVAFHPDGEQVLTGSMDGFARLWHMRTGKLTLDPMGLGQEIYRVDVDPTGRFVIAGSVKGGLRLWDLETGDLIQEFHTGTHYLSDIVFDEAGERFVTLGIEQGKLWNLADLQPIAELEHEENIWTAKFDQDGKTLVTGSTDAIKRWHGHSGKPLSQQTVLGRMTGFLRGATHFHFLPVRRELVFSSDDTIVSFGFDGQPSGTAEMVTSSEIRRLYAAPKRDHVAIAYTSGRVEVWEPFPERQLGPQRTVEGEVWHHARLIEGLEGEVMLAVGNRERSEVTTSALEQRELSRQRRTYPLEYIFDELAPIQPAGELMLRDQGTPGGIVLVDLSTGQSRRLLHDVTNWPLALFRDDRRMIAFSQKRGRLGVYAMDTGVADGFFDGAEDYTERLDLGPDDRLVAFGGDNGMLSLW